MEHIKWWYSSYENEDDNDNFSSLKRMYPESDLPKFNVGDEVMLVDDFINVNNNYINYPYTQGDYEKLKEIKNKNNHLIIQKIVYNITDKIIYYYFEKFKNYLGEPTLKPYLKRIDYNTPKKMVYEYLSFNEFLFESTEEVAFVISDELMDILSEIDHPISKRLMSDSDYTTKSTITLLDIIDGVNNMWYFVNSVKAIQYIVDKGGNPTFSRELFKYKKDIFDAHKSSIKIGKIIRKLYGDDYKETEIESFVNEYKKMFIVDFDLIDIVKGEKINYWYRYHNYTNMYDSPLCNSCMAGNDQNSYIDFYAVNSDKVSLVIMYEDETKNKIKARALLWKIDKMDGVNVNNVFFMDRVYFNSESDKNSMIKYAEQNGWYHKLKQNSLSSEEIYDPNTKQYEEISFTITDIKYPDNHKFPYVDTIKYLNIDNNLITNNYGNESKINYYVLHETDGSLDGICWSKFYNRFLKYSGNVIYARVSNNLHDYLYTNDCIYLDMYDNWYSKEFIKESDMIEIEKLPNNRKYLIFKGDAIFSNKYNKYYWKHDVRKIDDEYFPYTEIVRSNNLDTFLLKEDAVRVIIDDYSTNYTNDNIEDLNENNLKNFEFDYDYLPKDRTDLYFEYIGLYFITEYKKIIKNVNENK